MSIDLFLPFLFLPSFVNLATIIQMKSSYASVEIKRILTSTSSVVHGILDGLAPDGLRRAPSSLHKDSQQKIALFTSLESARNYAITSLRKQNTLANLS